MRLHFLHKAEAAAIRRGELQPDAASIRMVPGDDPIELRPVAPGLLDSAALVCTHRWSRWDRIRLVMPWFCLGLLVGFMIDITDMILRWIR